MIKVKQSKIDLTNTEIAFSEKSDKELKKMARIFSFMNHPWRVNTGSKLTLFAVKNQLPFAKSLIKSTIYEQFVGGSTLLECLPMIKQLQKQDISVVLDYGVEGKDSETDFNRTMTENLRAIEFVARRSHPPFVSTKVSGLTRFDLLEGIQREEQGNLRDRPAIRNVFKRLDSICHVAQKNGVSVFFDGEESWIQDAVDYFVQVMMERYNKDKPVVYQPFQLYRKDGLQRLFNAFNLAEEKGYVLGAKIVRGAYLEKERLRAANLGYPSPVHENKQATDDAFNMALKFCIENHRQMASFTATHNKESCRLQVEWMRKKKIQIDHPNLYFCQLYGMGDYLTYNLANAGFNVAKLIPYGPVKDVIPYLIRRAHENSSVTREMNREYELVLRELERRGIYSQISSIHF